MMLLSGHAALGLSELGADIVQPVVSRADAALGPSELGAHCPARRSPGQVALGLSEFGTHIAQPIITRGR